MVCHACIWGEASSGPHQTCKRISNHLSKICLGSRWLGIKLKRALTSCLAVQRLSDYDLYFPAFRPGDGNGKASGVSHQERPTFRDPSREAPRLGGLLSESMCNRISEVVDYYLIYYPICYSTDLF